MADKKISALTGASTPLAGTEVLPIVQGGSTVKVSVANLTAGRSVSTGPLTADQGPGGTSSFSSVTYSNLGIVGTSDSRTGGGAQLNLTTTGHRDWIVGQRNDTAYAADSSFFIRDETAAVTRLAISTTGVVSLNQALPVASGGTGTATPAIVAGTNVTVSGSWPNQTINSTGGSGGGISWQAVKTSGFTAVAGQGYPVNTTAGAITATLPATPSAGDMVTFVDYAGTSASNSITIAPNGNKIQGEVANVFITTARQAANLVYADATQGWISYADATVVLPATYSIAYLIAGAGGGGGGNGGGGGGAGGLLTGTYGATLSTTYSFVVGSGGAGGIAGAQGSDGNSATGFTLTAIGGGGGGYAAGTAKPGNAGGSGGGAGSGVDSGVAAAGGAGTGGQGLTGGAVDAGTSGGAGGGGAGATPPNVTSGAATAGGVGLASSITGSSVFYSGGGGGGGIFGAGAAGGNGGGGAGGNAVNGAGTAGTANTGGGGGGGAGGAAPGGNGAAGGKGVVILSMATSSYTGTVTGSPTVTTSGSNTIVTFTSSGSYTA